MVGSPDRRAVWPPRRAWRVHADRSAGSAAETHRGAERLTEWASMTATDGQHLDAETIAALAEGKGGVIDRTAVVRHLAECESCMAAYADAVRARAEWIAAPEGFRAPDEMVRLGVEAGRQPESAPAASEVASARREAPWRRPVLAWGLAATAAIIAVAIVWTGGVPGRKGPVLPAAVARGLEAGAQG